MDRRDFLKTAGLGVFSLFLPRFERGIWKPRPKPDWELALLDPNLKEFSGNGYARVSGSWADLSDPVTGTLANKSTLTFPAASGDWGTVYAARLFDSKNKLLSGREEALVDLSWSDQVRRNDTVQFLPGNFTITLT